MYITQITRSLKVLSITGDNSTARLKAGLSIGLDVSDGKPSILMNSGSVSKEGHAFSPAFMGLVKNIGG
jgi:hypothetical protein